MRLNLFRRWSGTALRRLRAVLVLVVAVAATLGYARFLGITYPVKDWLFWKVGMFWGWGLFLSVACVSLGHLVLSRALRVTALPTLETVVASAALGLLGFVFGLYLGGFLHLFNAPFAVILPAVMLASGARPLVRFIRERRAAWEALPRAPQRNGEAPAPLSDTLRSGVAALAILFGVVGVVFVYLGAFTPDAINFDSSWSHIPIAVDYARAGRIVPFLADYTRNVPHLASMVHTWAFLVPGMNQPVIGEPLRWMMVMHLEFFFFLWTLAGIAVMARWLLEEQGTTHAPRATWAAFFLFPAIFVYDNNLGGGADHYLAFFAAPYFVAAGRAMERFDRRLCVLAGAFAAGALLCKYQAVYLIVGVGFVIAGKWITFASRRLRLQWRARRAPKPTPADALALAETSAPTEESSPADTTPSTAASEESAPANTPPSTGAPANTPPSVDAPPSWRELAVGALAFAAALVIVSSPHFLKNWAFYKNPFYPFAQDIFKASTPTVPRAAYLLEWLFKDYRWRPHGTFLQNLLEALKLCFTFSFEAHYSFTKNVPNTGSLFTLGIPLVLFLRAPKRLWMGVAAGLGCVFMWGMTFRVDRHLQTFIPILAASTGAILVRAWDLGWIARAGILPFVGLQVVWGGDAMFYSGQSRIKGAIDMIRSGYDGGRDNRFSFRNEFREIGKGMPPNAKVVMHTYRPNLGIDRDIYMDWAGQQGLFSYEGVRGVRSIHELWRAQGITHVIFLPGREAPSKQEDVIFHDYMLHYGKSHRHSGGYEIVELAAEPPPPDHPYRVLALGLGGYKDGLYPIEAMNTYEGVPKHLLSWPAPAKPLPKDVAAALALVEEADAVVESPKPAIDPAVKARVDQLFPTSVSKGRSFVILYRKQDAAAPRPSGASPSQAPAPEGPDGEER